MTAIILAALGLPALFLVWLWWPGRRSEDAGIGTLIFAGSALAIVGLLIGSALVAVGGLVIIAIGIACGAIVRAKARP